MTNKELIKRFFTGRIRGDEESYGFYSRPHLFRPPPNMSLYSKTINTPIANRLSKNYFIIAPSDLTERNMAFASRFDSSSTPSWKRHIIKVHEIAKQLRVKFVLSPNASSTHFHKYMEEKINCNLLALANDLKTGSYYSVPRFTEVVPTEPKYVPVSEPEPIYTVPENYQELMGSIYALLEGESILELPKNQIALLDTDEVQSLWRWLLKENPDEKDRMILMRMYTLSRLLAPKGS